MVFSGAMKSPCCLRGLQIIMECTGMKVQGCVAVNTSLNTSQQELGQKEQTFSFLGRKEHCSGSVVFHPLFPKELCGLKNNNCSK